MAFPIDFQAKLNSVFTPGAPIDQKELFAGRQEQIRRVFDTVHSPGRHPILFGLRGVGKTSLANLLSNFLPDYMAVRVSCESTDNFKTIWNRVLREASVSFMESAFGFTHAERERVTNLSTFLGWDNGISAADIAGVLAKVQVSSIFILDEFDRVNDESTKSQLADLIKVVSDNHRMITFVIVGVGDSISDLIGHHPSIERNLAQIELPPMNADEIKEIVTKGCDRLAIAPDPAVLDDAAHLSNGFPHYAHLLGLSMGRACFNSNSTRVDRKLFDEVVCSFAVRDAAETYRKAFAKATQTAMPSRYPQMLCACASAVTDADGVFRATDVVTAYRETFGDDLSVQAVTPALGSFCSPDRGPVLNAINVSNRKLYRFAEPMMRPFLRIRTKTLLAG